jgi:4-amino-4-deoxy-L-arabinose transferase-like glycosyltransferase
MAVRDKMASVVFTTISPAAHGVFAFGFLMRLIAWVNTSVINPDGALFIHQARAIYHGQTDTLFCVLNYFSNLPLMILAGFWLFHDWVFAARFVSFIFGFATLIPLYFLLRRSFDERTSVLGTLIFAVMPVFVGSSVDIIRDPIAWFFAALGLYCFVLGLEGKASAVMVLSCLSFMMAVWARLECLVFIIFSIGYLVVAKQEQKARKILYFLIPLLGLSAAVFAFGLFAKGRFSADSGIQTALLAKLASPLGQYRTIQAQLSEAALHSRHENFGFLLGEVKKNLWLIAFGSLLNRCLEAFFYPFFFVCLVGVGVMLKAPKADQGFRYLTYISIGLLIAFYLHIFKTWYIEYRHLCLLIISCSFFIAMGLERIKDFMLKVLDLRERLAWLIIAMLILIIPLYKNILPRDKDKLVFKQIGMFLQSREQPNSFIPLSTSCSTFRIISFYANLDFRGAPCPEGSPQNCWEFFTGSDDEFIGHLKKENIKYFLWTEKLWPNERIDLFHAAHSSHLRELGRWSHPDTGAMILFEVI